MEAATGVDDRTLELVKLVLQVFIAFGAVGAAIFGWMSKRAIQEVHVQLDGRMTQILEMTREASLAEGRDSMRDDVLDPGGRGLPGVAGPAGATGVQGPIGPQGQVGPQGLQGTDSQTSDQP
jgi:hypothetical protein